ASEVQDLFVDRKNLHVQLALGLFHIKRSADEHLTELRGALLKAQGDLLDVRGRDVAIQIGAERSQISHAADGLGDVEARLALNGRGLQIRAEGERKTPHKFRLEQPIGS